MPTLPTIDAAPDLDALNLLAREAFDTEVESYEPAGKGLLGFVFRVKLKGDPGRVIVKWQKYAGKAGPETRQLDVLRRHACVQVPKVFYIHRSTPELPAEAMIMELLPGVQASSLVNPPMEVQEQIAEEAIDVLLHWHDVQNPDGYGNLDGPFYKRWTDYLKPELVKIYEDAKDNVAADAMPPIIPEMAELCLERIEDLLGVVERPGVLIHSDFWLPNVLIDPDSHRITGVLDPFAVRWDEPEADVVPMDWPWGEYDFLMKAYQRRRPLREGWPLRFAFHRFWFMLQATYLLGPGHAAGEAETLKKALAER